jgi:hypothetical protein
LSVLRKKKTISAESLRARVRLLIDEYVDHLSLSGNGLERRSVQKPSPSGTLLSYCAQFPGTFRSNRKSQADRNLSLIGKAQEEKEPRQALLGLCPSHDVDVTVNFLA